MRAIARISVLLVALAPSATSASETITYSYDARGRLVQVAHSGTVNNGATTNYVIDKADNRTSMSSSVGAPTPPSFSVGNASATEGGTLSFTITKSGSTSASFSVSYASANGTAVAGSDYTAVSGTHTFAPADTAKIVSVPTINDTAVESTEQMNLNLSGATGGATISDALGVGTINDNDSPPPGPSFAISNAAVVEGGTLVFTVTKTGSTSSSFSVNYATANGTASSADYTATSGTLTFTSAQTSKTINVVTTGEHLIEPDETVRVNLSGATGGSTITDSQGVGTILNDDDEPGPCPTC